MWQDTVIAICQFLFVVSLIPSVRSKDKPALATSLLSAVLVAIITATLFTLKLWLTTISAAMICVLWSVLAWQKYRLGRARVDKVNEE
jgi:hypothetical protein